MGNEETIKTDAALTYKCPNCDAGLLFDAEKQKFCCEFCLSEFTEIELNGTDAAEKAREEEVAADDFCSQMNEYHCPSCGAQIVADENTAADFCYFCHNPVVLMGKLTGQKKPNKIIPFKFDKKSAEEKFLAYARKKRFVPTDFFSKEHAEKISGVYFPFWVTDADTDSSLHARGTKIRSWRMGDYMYTETSRYDIHRRGNIHFEDIVTSALSDADKSMLEGILPYPSDSLEDFSVPYLLGYTAKKRDIERSELTGEVRDRMNNYAETLLNNTVIGYNTVSVLDTNVNVQKSHWEYALMPIWILTYKKGEKTYTYAMNGYTEKIYGELPISFAKLLALFGTIFVSVATVCAILGGMFL